ncbi:unnamed protein product [Mytilus coruscus]|uniref:Uncharacterized protein n=1 Tax=Mytilus coruscus TaxID=42192 RepID=A0A6J8D4V8_MYTCO|nr:unnamed protein product [Mytilus coruscus]
MIYLSVVSIQRTITKEIESSVNKTKRLWNNTNNRDKCEFGVNELEFYGYKFTKDGSKPIHDKDVDFEIMYEPRKNEADPLDFLSRHPFPEKENDETERMIKAIIHNEHAVILERLQEETNKDKQLFKLKDCILKTNWERNKKDMDIILYYHIRNELYIAE